MPARSSPSSTPYSAEDAARIRVMIKTPGTRVTCPSCEQEFTSASPIAGGGTVASVFELRCESCDQSVFLSDLQLGGPDP